MSKQRWAVIDCGKYPSVSDCKLVMKAPEERVEDLLDASVLHVCDKHEAENNEETREMIRGGIEYVEE